MQSEFLNLRGGLALVACLASFACAGDPDAGFGVERAAIVNGDASDESDDEVVALFAPINERDSLGCSGTLIAPDVVVTALHCVSYQTNPQGPFTCGIDGTLISQSPGAGLLGAPIDPEGLLVIAGAQSEGAQARGLRIFGTGSTQRCTGDLAVVVLDGPIGEDIAPVRFDRNVELGELMVAIGFGDTLDPTVYGRRRREGDVLGVGEYGDDPGSGTTRPGTFLLGEGACHGDSGGPALAVETGAVTGVYSTTIGAACDANTVRNAFTMVAPWESVVRDALEYAGREPLIEEGSGGSSGSSGNAGTEPVEGSGSRDDGTCACRAAGVRSQGAFAWVAAALVAFAAVRRSRRHPGA